MKRALARVRHVGAVLAAMMAANTCFAATFTKIAAGTQLMPLARAAVDPGGLVVAATKTGLIVGNGGTTTPIGLSANGYTVGTWGNHYEPVETAAGQIVFVATRATGAIPCSSPLAGVYRVATGGGPIASLYEECPNFNAPYIGGGNCNLSMSPNGTVAFSNMTSLEGAIFRGPMSGPVSSLICALSGNFSAAFPTAVNDSGRVVADFEYGPNLMRAVLAFDAPQGNASAANPPPYTTGLKASVTTMNVFGSSVAIGPSGTVAYSTGSQINVVTPVPFGGGPTRGDDRRRYERALLRVWHGGHPRRRLGDLRGTAQGPTRVQHARERQSGRSLQRPQPPRRTLIVARDDPRARITTALQRHRPRSRRWRRQPPRLHADHAEGGEARTTSAPDDQRPGAWTISSPAGRRISPAVTGPRPGVPAPSSGALPTWCGNLEGTCIGNVCRCGGLNQHCCEPGGTCGAGLSCSNLLCLVPANGTQACQQCTANRPTCQSGCKLDPTHAAHCDCLCQSTYCDCRKACGDLMCQFPSCTGK